jgi:cell envelope-related function transcriptional attenuator common domain
MEELNEKTELTGKKKKEKKKEKKKHKALKIILFIFLALILVLGIVFLIIWIRLSNMSKNAVKVDETTPLVVPDEIVAPDMPEIEDPSEIDWEANDDFEDLDDFEVSFDSIFHRDRINSDVVNILLLGNDARDQYDHGRSDTMMLLSYNRKARTAKLVSFLRDTWIYIPGRSTWNRLNTAYRFGGVGLAINTINVNFDLDIQYYMRVDFNSLREIVDSVGGVDVQLTAREVDYINKHSNWKLTQNGDGVYHLNGDQALRHARNRSIGGDGDWSRTRRQRDILYAMLNSIKKDANVSSLISLVRTLTDYVETNLTAGECIDLALDFIFGKPTVSLANRAVPFEGTWRYAWEGRMAVIHIDIAANRAKLHQYLYGGNTAD